MKLNNANKRESLNKSLITSPILSIILLNIKGSSNNNNNQGQNLQGRMEEKSVLI